MEQHLELCMPFKNAMHVMHRSHLKKLCSERLCQSLGAKLANSMHQSWVCLIDLLNKLTHRWQRQHCSCGRSVNVLVREHRPVGVNETLIDAACSHQSIFDVACGSFCSLIEGDEQIRCQALGRIPPAWQDRLFGKAVRACLLGLQRSHHTQVTGATTRILCSNC
jgi:hypothetical protein